MFLRLSSLALLALSFAAAAQTPSAATESVSPPVISIVLPPELDRVLRDYEKAWAAGNVDAVVGLFAADSYALPNGAPPAYGHDAAREAYREHIGSPLSLRAIAYRRDGNLAYVVGGFAFARSKPSIGKFVLVLGRNAEGRWEILADIDNMDQRPGAGPAQAPAQPAGAPQRQP